MYYIIYITDYPGLTGIFSGIVSGVIASILFISIVYLYNHLKFYLKFRRLVGEYNVFLKREETKKNHKIKVTKIVGSKLKVKLFYDNSEREPAYGEIQMNEKMPKYGTGYYSHVNSKHGWGTWNIQVISNDEIFVDNQYQTSGSTHFYSYVWRKDKKEKKI